MNPAAILYPVIALAVLTFIVLLLIPYQRAKALILKQMVIDDLKFGESKNVSWGQYPQSELHEPAGASHTVLCGVLNHVRNTHRHLRCRRSRMGLCRVTGSS